MPAASDLNWRRPGQPAVGGLVLDFATDQDGESILDDGNTPRAHPWFSSRITSTGAGQLGNRRSARSGQSATSRVTSADTCGRPHLRSRKSVCSLVAAGGSHAATSEYALLVATIEAQVIRVHDEFCRGFANRDPGRVLGTCALDPGLAVVTSESPLLRGPDELRSFLAQYVAGPATYSWEWEWRDVSSSGEVAWLLAVGTETASSIHRVEQHPYRMTMVLERRDDAWLIQQVHGSSPQ